MIEEVMPIVSLSRRRSTRTAVDGEAGVQMSRGEPGVPVSCDFLFIQEGEEGEWRGILAFWIMLTNAVWFHLLLSNDISQTSHASFAAQPDFDPGLLRLTEREPSASDCFERQNMSFFSLCSFFGALKVDTVAADDVCGLNSSLAFAVGPNELPMSCDKLWILDRLRRRSAITVGSRVLEAPEELR
jgi:hypothetical protein